MKRKKVRKIHSVKAITQILELTKAGSSMTLEVYASKEKIGTIVIGRGSFEWLGKGKKIGKRYSWTRFAEIMDYLQVSPLRIKKTENL